MAKVWYLRMGQPFFLTEILRNIVKNICIQAALVPARRVPCGHLQQGGGQVEGGGDGEQDRAEHQRGLRTVSSAGPGWRRRGQWAESEEPHLPARWQGPRQTRTYAAS